MYYLASAYNMIGYVEHSVFLLEKEKELSPLNAYLLAKFYYNLKKYDKFIKYCVCKSSYRPEVDNCQRIIKKFGKYSAFILKLLSQHFMLIKYYFFINLFKIIK